jgi:hypothetical protein
MITASVHAKRGHLHVHSHFVVIDNPTLINIVDHEIIVVEGLALTAVIGLALKLNGQASQ